MTIARFTSTSTDARSLGAARERLLSLDACRVVAILAVIVLHTMPFYGTRLLGGFDGYIAAVLNQGARFAVPFFFLASGFFFGRKYVEDPERIGNTFHSYFKRLLLIFILWSFIYILVPSNLYDFRKFDYTQILIWKVQTLAGNPATIIFEGARIHLWFIASLVMALGLVAAFLRLGWRRYLLPMAVALYLLGVLGGSYSQTPLGLDFGGFSTRDGPFFSCLFVVVGFLFAYHKIEPSTGVGILIAVCGVALHAIEVIFLWRHYAISPYAIDYVFGTAPFGIGIFSICLANPTVSLFSWMPRLAKFTLGIYVSHRLVDDLIKTSEVIPASIFWEISRPFAVYALSLLFVMMLHRSKYTRRLVV